MAEFNREMAIQLMLDGQPPLVAVMLGHGGLLSRNHDINFNWIVKPTGSLGRTPTPECVANRLKERTAPYTRADIEWALDACAQ